METFNLLTRQWIPVRRLDGRREVIGPWELTEGESAAIDVDAVRPDFRGALLEFLVGLVQTALPPENKKVWRGRLTDPPAPQTLQNAFKPLEPYFNLFGDRPRFMQDLTLAEKDVKDPNGAAALLIDSPGDNALRHNGDFFVKRGRVEQLCPICAAAALFTLQAYAPAGGVGNRTSLRGGGPLTTLVLGKTLWETVWSNVQPLASLSLRQAPDAQALAKYVFPWAAPTKVSEKKGSELRPEEVEPYQTLHALWGMPRRIVLLLETLDEPEVCHVCGEASATMVRRYLSKNYGNNYSDGWRHPLTPYRDQGQDKPTLSIKGTSDGAGYNHWLGLVYGSGDEERTKVLPATCVVGHRDRAKSMGREERLLAFGYNMDNMKAVQWCEGSFPLLDVPEEGMATFRNETARMVLAADQVRRNIISALKEALFADGGRNAKADQTLFANVSKAFWGGTENAFYERVKRLVPMLDDEEARFGVYADWAKTLKDRAETLFIREADSGAFSAVKAGRIYEALKKMRIFNHTNCAKILRLSKAEEE